VGDKKILLKKTTVVVNKACDEGDLFDPFDEKCVQIYKPTISGNPNSLNETTVHLSCNGSGFVKMDLSSATLFPNGSIWIPLHNRLYNNGSNTSLMVPRCSFA